MADTLGELKDRLAGKRITIALGDAHDRRTLTAAAALKRGTEVVPLLVGDSTAIARAASEAGADITGIEIADPASSKHRPALVAAFAEVRSHRGVTAEAAAEALRDPLIFGGMMVRMRLAAGMIAGSVSATPDVIRAAIQTVGMRKGVAIVSSFFLMASDRGAMSFADCGVIPDPDAGQLCEIAGLTADNHRRLTGQEPRVAFLSFSTRGSADHPALNKITRAAAMFRQARPEITSDGELQLDSAVVPDVARRKAPDSPIGGNANVLIFPDLNSGNIGYKIAERFGGMRAYGPILQGLAAPMFDLSRGCSADDIAGMALICAAGAA